MNAAYVLEITSQCPHKGQVNLSGNAYNLSSIAATCAACGKPVQINSAQEVGLAPSAPGFEERVDKLTAEFSTFTYYLVIVANQQMTMELRQRKNIRLDFLLFCETCNKPIDVESQTQQKLKTGHKGHAVTVSPRGDAIPTGVLLETFRQQMEQFLGQPLVAEKSGDGEDRFRVKWS